MFEIERVEFLFWPVTADNSAELLETWADDMISGRELRWPAIIGNAADRFKAGECEWRWSEACDSDSEDDFVERFLGEHFGTIRRIFLNVWLRPALRRIGAFKFVPAGEPSWKYRPTDRVLELCMYHDTLMHDAHYATSGVHDIIYDCWWEPHLLGRYERYGVSSHYECLYADDLEARLHKDEDDGDGLDKNK